MDIARILIKIRPGAEWSINGNTFKGINWLDKKQLKPTLEEIEAAEAGVLADIVAEQAALAQKETDISDCLPSWSEVETIFDNLKTDAQAATTLVACKAVLITLITIVKKLTRVVYWLAKNKAD